MGPYCFGQESGDRARAIGELSGHGVCATASTIPPTLRDFCDDVYLTTFLDFRQDVCRVSRLVLVRLKRLVGNRETLEIDFDTLAVIVILKLIMPAVATHHAANPHDTLPAATRASLSSTPLAASRFCHCLKRIVQRM
jgi:hypothetical protein